MTPACVNALRRSPGKTASRSIPAKSAKSAHDQAAHTRTPTFAFSLKDVSIKAPGKRRFDASRAWPVPPKLAVGIATDPLEQEADRVADHVMHTGQEQAVLVPIRHADSAGGAALAPPIVHAVLGSSGHPLDSDTRGFMEPRFGFDFSSVKLHTDAQAAESARAIQAQAYTAGHHVVLGAGRSGADRRLLAHELAHVVQQAELAGFSTLRRQPASTANTGEYIPVTGAPEHQPTNESKDKAEVLGRLDVDDLFTKNPAISQRVLAIADELGLDPGMLAESLYAETATAWMRTKGKIASEELGMDDWFDAALEKRLKDIIDAHPALGLKFTDVKKTGRMWNTGTEKSGGGLKPRGRLDADKAVQAWAVYVKMQVDMLREILARDPSLQKSRIKNLDDLTPEQRLAIERVATNAGVGIAHTDFMILARGGDLPRTGSVRRDKNHPLRTATLHMGRAVHLDQAVFGRPASDYRPAPPPPPPVNQGGLELDEDPQLKKLPPWITPFY